MLAYPGLDGAVEFGHVFDPPAWVIILGSSPKSSRPTARMTRLKMFSELADITT